MRDTPKMVILTLVLMSCLPWSARSNELATTVAGIEEVRVPAGVLVLLRAELEPLETGTASWMQIVGDEVSIGSRLYVWDAISKRYWVEEKTAMGWEPEQRVAGRGEGFWLLGSGSSPGSEMVVRQVGQVPGLRGGSASMICGIQPGFSLLGYPYSGGVVWTNMGLLSEAPVGSVLLRWEVEGQVYRTYEKGEAGWKGSWDGPMGLLEGFAMDATSAWKWEERAPYTWPGTLPGLEVVSVRVLERTIQLALKASTWTDRVWEVYASESGGRVEDFLELKECGEWPRRTWCWEARRRRSGRTPSRGQGAAYSWDEDGTTPLGWWEEKEWG